MNRDKLISVLKGAGLAGGGAALVYLLDAVSVLPLGPSAPIVTAALSVLLNVVRKAATA